MSRIHEGVSQTCASIGLVLLPGMPNPYTFLFYLSPHELLSFPPKTAWTSLLCYAFIGYDNYEYLHRVYYYLLLLSEWFICIST